MMDFNLLDTNSETLTFNEFSEPKDAVGFENRAIQFEKLRIFDKAKLDYQIAAEYYNLSKNHEKATECNLKAEECFKKSKEKAQRYDQRHDQEAPPKTSFNGSKLVSFWASWHLIEALLVRRNVQWNMSHQPKHISNLQSVVIEEEKFETTFLLNQDNETIQEKSGKNYLSFDNVSDIKNEEKTRE